MKDSPKKPNEFKVPPLVLPKLKESRILDLVKKIVQDTGSRIFLQLLDDIIVEIQKTRVEDLTKIYHAIEILKTNQNIAKEFADYYKKIPKEDFDKRLITLAAIGNLQNSEFISFFKEIVWSNLPDEKYVHKEGALSEKNYEEIIQVKAMQGIAYLRTKDSFSELEKIMLEHKSKHVKASTIDAFLWNNNDSKESIEHMQKILPTSLHRYIGRARFHHNMNVDEFNKKLDNWRKKWG